MDIGRIIAERLREVTRPEPVRGFRTLEAEWQATTRRAVAEAVDTSANDEPPPGGKPGERSWGYRPLGAGQVGDLLGLDYGDIYASATRLEKNPLAYWCLGQTVNHVIGGGVTYRVSVKRKNAKKGIVGEEDQDAVKATEWLDVFWKSHDNAMDFYLRQLVYGLFAFGNQFIPVFPAIQPSDGATVGDGSVKLGYLDPGTFTELVFNPENVRDVIAAKFSISSEDRVYRLVHVADEGKHKGKRVGLVPPANARDPKAKWVDEVGAEYDGAILYWAHDRLPNGRFGYPLLIRLDDYLKQADLHFFDLVDRVLALNAFVWWVTLKGSDESKQRAWLKQQGWLARPPKGREVVVTNENATLQPMAPSLGQADLSTLSRWLLLFILGSAGLPLHWFGEAENTNRASAESMAAPTRKRFEGMQDDVKWHVEDLLKYVLDTAVIQRSLPDLEYVVEVQMPQIAADDTAADMTVLKVCAEALTLAIAAKTLTTGQAIYIYESVAGQLGIDVPEKEAVKALEPVPEPAPEQPTTPDGGDMPEGKPVKGKPVEKVEKPPVEESLVQEDDLEADASDEPDVTLPDEIKQLPTYLQEGIKANVKAGRALMGKHLKEAMAKLQATPDGVEGEESANTP